MKAFIAVAFAVTVISAPALSKDIQMNHCFSDDQSTAAIDVVQQHEPRDRLPRDLDQLRYLRDTACLDIEMMMDYVRQKTAETNGEIDTVDVIKWYVDQLQKRAAMFDAALKYHEENRMKKIPTRMRKAGLKKPR